ncbi:hypothetical protein FKM82_018256 [Ascaphus truei]
MLCFCLIIQQARKGTLKLLLPGSFSPICDQHKTGIQILQSVQNLSFQPAMPRPPPSHVMVTWDPRTA